MQGDLAIGPINRLYGSNQVRTGGLLRRGDPYGKAHHRRTA
jgi:hypothetical protein